MGRGRVDLEFNKKKEEAFLIIKERDVTATDLANELGVTFHYITRVLTALSLDEECAICDYTGKQHGRKKRTTFYSYGPRLNKELYGED